MEEHDQPGNRRSQSLTKMFCLCAEQVDIDPRFLQVDSQECSDCTNTYADQFPLGAYSIL